LTSTPYQYAGVIGKVIKNTEIKVDKQNGVISLLNSNLTENYYNKPDIDGMVDIIDGDITELRVQVDGIEAEVQNIGGTNLLKNSVGLKGEIKEWQVYDDAGTLIDSDNDGTVVQTFEVGENSESNSAIQINEQFITQTVTTIVGELYTFYVRFKKLNDVDLTITGQEAQKITINDYVDETWGLYKYEFTASSASTTIKIDNTASGVGSYAILSDMVVKLGSCNGWVQAPNEVYGRNFRFDTDGFEITSLSDNFKSVLDNTKFAVYDTSGATDKNIMVVSKDEARMTKLTAQEQMTIQRYENSEKACRFIPTSTGLMIVVND